MNASLAQEQALQVCAQIPPVDGRNAKIFLVQLQPGLRFLYDSGEGVRRGTGLSTAFISRLQAEEWASSHPPIQQNPFVDTGDYDDDDGNEWISFWTDWNEGHDDAYVRGEEFRQLVYEIGLTPPPGWQQGDAMLALERTHDGAPNGNPWFRWWEDTASTMTEIQKAALWKFVIPHPYRIVEVELEP